MPPDYPDDEIENEDSDISSEAEKIVIFFGDFFKFLEKRLKIKIMTSDLIDFILKNNLKISPVVLCMHVVHLLLNSYYTNLSRSQLLTPEEKKLADEIEKSAPREELWNFEPDEYYLNLAINFIEELRKIS